MAQSAPITVRSMGRTARCEARSASVPRVPRRAAPASSAYGPRLLRLAARLAAAVASLCAFVGYADTAHAGGAENSEGLRAESRAGEFAQLSTDFTPSAARRGQGAASSRAGWPEANMSLARPDLDLGVHVGPPAPGDGASEEDESSQPERHILEGEGSAPASPGQATSLPSGPSTVMGLGESFSPQLSTGIATYQVPLKLPVARGGVQPRLDLSYMSAGGWGLAGFGWSLGASAISRKTDRGLPHYDDRASWHPGQDRFVFGGMDLVPIGTVKNGACAGAPDERFPGWASGWQYFRARIEGGFLRFFWAPNHRTWRVQSRDGGNFEFGVPLDGSGYAGALEANRDRPSEIFRWYIVRQYDSHGDVNVATPRPVNAIVYRYAEDGGALYLSDLYYTSPAATPTTTDLTTFAHHVRLTYEPRPDTVISYRSGWPVEHLLRVAHVDVSSKPFTGGATAARELTRRYWLAYEPDAHSSLLAGVTLEGRCDEPLTEDDAGALDAAVSCPALPALTFTYQRARSSATPLRDLYGFAFEPFSTAVKSLPASPPHSLDDPEAGLLDVNADGLPDLLVTSAGRYAGKHALFLNGAAGKPGFGAALPMRVDPVGAVDAGVLTLGSSRVAAMDHDADGLVDLVHMTHDRRYSVFSPVVQGSTWSWQGKSVQTVSGQDNKIDLVTGRRNTRTMDVDGDGLVDVVYSSATELQTFFALGRYPGGENQFGQASWTSATTAKLSNDPLTACVPWSATPVRFSDSDVQVGDLNGDGLPDLARLRSGQLLYWPGRGNGTWGTGARDDCDAGDFGVERHITMHNPPRFGVTAPGTLLLGDVNGDGLADLVEVRTRDVDIYLNDNGVAWTDRFTLSGVPVRSSLSSDVRITDIDGSGSPDILWGKAYDYRYLDLTGGVSPYLLVRAENGLGMTTDLEYASSVELMLAAKAAGSPWQAVSPTVTAVLTRTTLQDNLDRVGRPAGVYATEYRYRDAVFAGRERAFRGFREAVTVVPGDATSATSYARTRFLLGDCPAAIHGTAGAVCGMTDVWRDNWREALKGLPLVSETYDDAGITVASAHTTYELRQLLTGLDAQRVMVVYPLAKDAFAYDASSRGFDHAEQTVTLPEVVIALDDHQATESAPFTVRATRGTARVRSESRYDDYGNVTESIQHGCVSGCPEGPDETITAHSTFELPDDDASGWLWRETTSHVTGSVHAERRSEVKSRYDGFGKLVEARAVLSGTLPLDRHHEADLAIAPAPTGASGGIAAPVELVTLTNTYNALGQVTFVRGANGRCSSSSLDAAYSQLTVSADTYLGAVGASGCGERKLTSRVDWDRGLEAVVGVTDATGQPGRAAYDGFGRVVSLTGGDPARPGELAALPSQLITYELTSDPDERPYSAIIVHTLDGQDFSTESYRESWAFTDGLGRTLASLSQADPSAGDEGDFIVGPISDYNTKGLVSRRYEPWFYSGSAAAFPLGSAPPGRFGAVEYDPFGRPVTTYGIDGDVAAHVVRHALSEDAYDAADLAAGPRQGTYVTTVSDGHGRGVRRTERVHKADGRSLEQHHVLNEYLPTGEVLRVIQRRQGSPDVVRWLRYDSLGRLVLNAEPNTTRGFTPDPNQDVETLAAWRYAYNDSGEFVGTSDARGCGVNYHYDAAGRLLATDRSPCALDHDPYTAPDLATGDGTESFIRYDRPDPDSASVRDDAGNALVIQEKYFLGRVASVSSLGSKSVVSYDATGRVLGSARRIAKPGAPSRALASRYAPRWYVQTQTLDVLGRPLTATTGVTTPALLGADGTSELRFGYSKRGAAHRIDSSYGLLLDRLIVEADGRLTSGRLGDGAKTERAYRYDARRRVRTAQTYRGAAELWSTTGTGSAYRPPGPSDPPTTQLLLEDLDFDYDLVGNIVQTTDYRIPEEWPDTAKPVTKRYDYDDKYRLTRVRSEYPAGNPWQSPYEAENEDPTLSPQPMPHAGFDTRVVEQTFSYDWLGNLARSGDDQGAFWDRSLGKTTTGSASDGPHQLRRAENRSVLKTAKTAKSPGELEVEYDATGNVTSLVVHRDPKDGKCLPEGASCWQRFSYTWDVVGQLTRARRWDLTPNEQGQNGWLEQTPPARAPEAELHYTYDDSGERVLKTVLGRGDAKTLHTVYALGALELRRTEFDGTDYRVEARDVELRLPAGLATARLLYTEKDLPSLTSQARVHLLLSLSDSVGSTSTVIEHATGELVEAASYLAYGAAETSARSERWGNERDPYRFGGKEEDLEVGLSYFGARYYSPFLGAWLSADPVTVHELGSDTNPYAYVHGSPLMGVDPDGREPLTILAVIGISMAVGALVGAGSSVAIQASQGNGWDLGRVNGWKVLGAAAVGAVAGGVSGGLGSWMGGAAATAFGEVVGAAATGATAGAAGGTASYLTSALVSWTAPSWEGLGQAAAMGAVGGGLGGAGGALTGGGFGGAMAGGATGAGGSYGFGMLAFGAEFSEETFFLSIGGGMAGGVAGEGIGEVARHTQGSGNEDVIAMLVVDEEGASGFGHAAVAVKDSNGDVWGFSQAPGPSANPIKTVVGKVPGEVRVLKLGRGSFEQALGKLADVNGTKWKFDAAIEIRGTAKMAEQMLGYARQAASAAEPYNLFTNNCVQNAVGIIEAGGVDLPALLDPRPNPYVRQLGWNGYHVRDLRPLQTGGAQ